MWLQAALAAGALTWAFVTWQRPKETRAENAVALINATKSSLEQVHYEDGTRFLEVKRVVDPEPTLWVTQGYLPGKTPVIADAGYATYALDAGVDGGAPLQVSVKPAEPPPTRELRGSERADALYGKFTPLDVTRALGVLPPEKLAELGLIDSPRRLTVTVAGTTRAFTVSKPLPGVIGSYLLDEQTKDVSLLQGTLLTELDPGSQVLVDRRLHTFRAAEVDRFVVTVKGASAEFLQTPGETPEKSRVARAATPDKAEELVKNWADKVFSRIVVTDVLGKGELPKTGEPTVGLKIEYTFKGRPRGWLEVARDSAGTTWARSENTASWVAVHQGAEELLLEAEKNIVVAK
jgi:hypothetical protein